MLLRERIQWVLEADIRSFFDSIDRKKLMELLQLRVVDGSLLRLVGKCLHVGVLDGETFTKPEDGTAQGSIISPLLGNVYLLDLSPFSRTPGSRESRLMSASPCTSS